MESHLSKILDKRDPNIKQQTKNHFSLKIVRILESLKFHSMIVNLKL